MISYFFRMKRGDKSSCSESWVEGLSRKLDLCNFIEAATMAMGRAEVCCVTESLVLIYSGRMIFQEI